MKEDNDIVTIPPSARRRAELAALEREIGQAVIACRDTEAIILHAENQRAEADVDVIAYRAAERRIIEQEAALDALITRWRELHAAGVEGERS